MRSIILFLLTLVAFNSSAQFKGRVYIAETKLGVAKVIVSDGYEVVQTDADGYFELPYNIKSRFVYISSPFGYKVDKKHYIKVDEAVDSYDFFLLKDNSQNKDVLDFIHISDTETHIYGSWIENLRRYSKERNNSLIMHTGDICYEPGMRFHAQQVNADLMGLPVYYAVGNHDLVAGEYGEKLFEDLFGPTYYSFEAGPAYFVVTPMWNGDYTPSYTRDQVISWLKKDLAFKDKSKPLIFINHDFAIGPDFVLKGKEESIDLKEFNLKAWLYGHWHNNYSFVNQDAGVRVISTNAPNKGGIDNAVGQFLQIEVTKEGVKGVEARYTNLNDHIVLLDPYHHALDSKAHFQASVYDSNREIESVEVTVLDNMGSRLFTVPLRFQSDWTWVGENPWRIVDESYTTLTEVHYSTGEHSIRKQVFGGEKQSVLKKTWSHNIGSNVWKVSPLIVDELLVTASFDDGANGRAKIVALDTRTGKEVWSYSPKNSIKQKLRYHKGTVLATDVGGVVYALDIKSGKEVWTKSLSGGTLPSYVTAGALYSDIYYTGYGKYLSALDVSTGELIWQNKDWNGGEAMPGEIVVTESHLYTGANWNSLFVHDRLTGKLLWSKNEDGLRFRSSGVAVEKDKVYATGLNTIFVLDQANGDVLLEKFTAHDFKVTATPHVNDDQLLLATSTEGLWSFDKNTLDPIWSFDTREALIYTSSYSSPDNNKPVATVESAVTLMGEDYIFGGSDGFLYILDKKGELIEETNLGAPILAEVTVHGEAVYVVDFAGNVYRFDRR